MTNPVNPSEKAALSLASSLGNQGSRIIATRFRCPMCGSFWVIETVGDELPRPIPGDKLGAALLCGRCEARRRLLFRRKDGVCVPLWTDRDGARLWAIVLGSRDRGEEIYTPRHKFRDQEMEPGYKLQDDRETELRRIVSDGQGRNRAAITEEGIRALGLDWKVPGTVGDA